MGDYYRPHLAMLLHVIDELREEQRAQRVLSTLKCGSFTYERATAEEAKSGWTLRMQLLKDVEAIINSDEDGREWCPDLEVIEQVLLALEKRGLVLAVSAEQGT